jgi:hypothetical protein
MLEVADMGIPAGVLGRSGRHQRQRAHRLAAAAAGAGFVPRLIAEDLTEQLPSMLRAPDLYISGGHA